MAANVTFIQDKAETISFGARLAGSDAFRQLFRDGMGLVEEAAAYLDGPGRAESRSLVRSEALAYASESMRLTTRLMQLASWLLLQRAVNEGEMTLAQAATEKHKVKLVRQERSLNADMFARMPDQLQELVARSMRLQDRILHLDSLLYGDAPQPGAAFPTAITQQLQMLQQAFSARMQ